MPVVPSKLPDVVLFEVQELRRVRDHDQVLRSCVAQQVPPLVCSADREMEAAVAVVVLLSPWSFAAQHSLPGSCCAATGRQLPAKVVLSMSQAKTGP